MPGTGRSRGMPCGPGEGGTTTPGALNTPGGSRREGRLLEGFWRPRSAPAAFGSGALVSPRGEAMPPCPRVCPGSGSAGSPAPVSADACWCRASRDAPGSIPGQEASGACPASAVRYCSVGSAGHASSQSAEPRLCAERQRWPRESPSSKASPNPSLFRPAPLFLDVYRTLCRC